MNEWLGIFTVFLLVAANGFFVAAEFSLVAIRRSRVTELVAQGRANAKVLLHTVDRLDASLAATQLGITLSSLALGWVGEPALAHLIVPLLEGWAGKYASVSAEVIAVAIAFSIITALHIVLGELAPKSLALQRSEDTALWVVRPLNLFLLVFRPAIVVLNGLGNLVLRICGLRPGASEEMLHSAEELKLLVSASQEAGLLLRTQQEVVERVFNIGDRRIGDIMTPRTDIVWIDMDNDRNEILQTLRECHHEHILVGRGDIDELLGMLTKRDLLDQHLDGRELDPQAALQTPLSIQESTPIFKVLERFRAAPVRMAVVRNEYGGLEGIVTQADLLEAMVGHLPDAEGDMPHIVEREDGSLLIDGACPIFQMFERLGLRQPAERSAYHTAAGFVLAQLAHMPQVGEYCVYEGWRLEVVDTDGRRIDKVLATRA
ncbi:HlyC/CorC family transporter [Dyella sp. M7H15-1]|uniref:hemolysin family protein n=1 Tax=Dyella sp. M7H15-1 TaxID=2501295 RepID=UPI0010050048|nr:hemolysin family protein [Dyella sp. M7H15-1]QAU24815.1 HlyC/CorC family transporter [Dyella sp. M7H15-1]